ncbi:hypothetical protein LTR56_003825 [Elasticomyces elasticus]|nr:hypothetical protein LTR22_013114 [Elasticomyces elasticus]KAK3654967.1 hypothetical protein LTR56_003825 [Elasticomyces elasticus]KAK4928701.1 hypothetical protein LTR49_004510 [Elasticomyces elasticus]KAK5766671.1 hypothetical protein LTS12_003290 [Elasticomyces elasticus]
MSGSRLLQLPAELRNRIFELVVVKPQPIPTARCKLCCKDQHAWPSERIIPQQPAVTRVNRQLRTEVLPIYYGQNTFWIPREILREQVGVQEWWHSFANVAAVKHINNLIYAFLPPKLPSRSAVGITTSDLIEIELQGAEVGQTKCEIRGLPGTICTCSIISSLKVSAARGIEHALPMLHDCVEPYLSKFFKKSRARHRPSVASWLAIEASGEGPEQEAAAVIGHHCMSGVRDLETGRPGPGNRLRGLFSGLYRRPKRRH